jgi:hypothetical protein
MINPKSAGGKLCVNNELILWMLLNESQYGFNQAIWNLTKSIIETEIPPPIRHLITFAQGLPLGKFKNGQNDGDVRPIIIMDSIMRLVDKLAILNIPEDVRRQAMGHTQMIGKRSACEISSIAVEYAIGVMNNIDDEVILNLDAANAYIICQFLRAIVIFKCLPFFLCMLYLQCYLSISLDTWQA